MIHKETKKEEYFCSIFENTTKIFFLHQEAIIQNRSNTCEESSEVQKNI